LTVTNKVTAGQLQGEGGNIGNIQGGNVSGAVSSATSATTAGTVTTAAQPNITSVGTLTSLGVSGNITAANITANTGVFTGNGNGLSSIQGANVTGAVAYATTANSVAGGNVTGTVGFATSATSATTAGTVTTAAQPNITSVGTLTAVNSSGNVTAPNVVANTGAFYGAATGLTGIPAANVTGTLSVNTTGYSATVSTAAQPNITSVGTLSSLSVTGNTSSGNVIASTYHIRSIGTGISAAGSTQGTATAITKEINVVSTVSAGQGVILPGVAGTVITITNSSATALLVYPASGGVINTLATNTALSIPAGATLQFVAPTATQWYTVGATYA
jgi:hypothetical protein